MQILNSPIPHSTLTFRPMSEAILSGRHAFPLANKPGGKVGRHISLQENAKIPPCRPVFHHGGKAEPTFLFEVLHAVKVERGE